MKTTTPDPNDSWALAELYRWQRGELPPQDDTCKPLDEPAALRAVADAIENDCKTKNRDAMPPPFYVCFLLRYVAEKMARASLKGENAEMRDRHPEQTPPEKGNSK